MTNFFNALGNSAMVTTATVVLTLLTNSLVAYAIARNMNRKFFKGLYFYFISAMFIPFPIIMSPLVKLTAGFNMTNLVGLTILHTVYALAFNVFVYVGYIKSIPIALEEAARVDGTSTWGTFWRIIFPIMAPINATVGILICLSTYNDFLFAAHHYQRYGFLHAACAVYFPGAIQYRFQSGLCFISDGNRR